MASASGVFSNRSRYSLVHTVNQNWQDVGGNYSNLGVDLRINETTENGSYSLSNPVTWSWNVDGQTASGASTYDFRQYDVLVLSSTNINVGHNADGTKWVGFSAAAGGTSVIGSASCSSGFWLTTIPRATTPNWSGDFEAGVSKTINLPRASGSFTHTVEYYFGNTSGTIGTGAGTSVNWTPPMSLLQQIPNAASGTGLIRVLTYNGSTFIGSKDVGFTLVAPASVIPDFDTILHDEATPGVEANVGAYVQNISTLALTLTGAVGIYGSTIKTTKIEVLNSLGNPTYVLNGASGTTAILNLSGTVTLRGTVTDSRNRSKTKTVNISFLPYTPPVFNSVSVERALSGGTPDDEGTYLRVNLNAQATSLFNGTERNVLNYRISTRVRGTTTWTEQAEASAGGLTYNSFSVFGTFTITQAYEVLIEIFDDFVTTAVIQSLPVSIIFMHWDSSDGVGIGKYREDGALDVSGDVYAKPHPTNGQGGVFVPSASGHGVVTDRLPHSGTTAQRDAYYGVPATTAARVALANRRVVFYNVDNQWYESFYTNTGAGLSVPRIDSAYAIGWYPIGPGPWAVLSGAAQARNGSQAFTNYRIWGDLYSERQGPIEWSSTTNPERMTLGVAGFYDIRAKMGAPNGSGTGVASLRLYNSAGTQLRIDQRPVTLLASFGQQVDFSLGIMKCPLNSYLVFMSDSGSWTITVDHISVQYVRAPVTTPVAA